MAELDRGPSGSVLATLVEAAAALPWPVAQIDDIVCRFARAATGSERAECTPVPTGDPQCSVALSVPFGSRRQLTVCRSAGRPPYTVDDHHALRVLVAMATASQESAVREAVLQQQMATDALTGLWSYPKFREGLRALARSCPPEDRWAVLFLDLDHFKTINTRLGHLDADEVLREVARRIASVAEPPTLSARFGGDEFLIAVAVPGDDPDTSREALDRLTDQLTNRIRQPMRVGGQFLQVNVAVGASVAPREAEDVDAVIRQAEAAMRAAKLASSTHGPPRWVDERRRIREFLDEREVRVEYQPILDLRERRISGFEALLRVTDPEMGPISPELLVDAATRIRLLDELTLLVSEQASEAMSQLAPLCEHRLRVAINLEFAQLDADNVTLSWLVERFEDAPVDLLLELTERSSLDWTRAHEDVARGLRRQGIELAIDDFGAGYATYHFLDAWDWSLVKIDRGLIRAHDRYGQLLLRHVASLLTDIGTRSVAEGIETAEHLQLVTELGIDYAQGYFIGRPMPATAILDLAATGWLTDPLAAASGGQPRGSA